MHSTINKYSLVCHTTKNILCGCLKRHSSHFVYHPEPISNELGEIIFYKIITSVGFVLLFIVNQFSGKTSKKNMYQAINNAMDLVLSKDSNSGNLL